MLPFLLEQGGISPRNHARISGETWPKSAFDSLGGDNIFHSYLIC